MMLIAQTIFAQKPTGLQFIFMIVFGDKMEQKPDKSSSTIGVYRRRNQRSIQPSIFLYILKVFLCLDFMLKNM